MVGGTRTYGSSHQPGFVYCNSTRLHQLAPSIVRKHERVGSVETSVPTPPNWYQEGLHSLALDLCTASAERLLRLARGTSQVGRLTHSRLWHIWDSEPLVAFQGPMAACGLPSSCPHTYRTLITSCQTSVCI